MTKIIDEHLSGEGTQANPYVIHDSTGLGYLSGANLEDYGVDKYYELGADIDMSSVASFTPIGTSSIIFIGSFDGKNHTISNMTITGTSNLGLFHTLSSGATPSNIIFNGADVISSSGEYVGILCSINNGGNISNVKIYESEIDANGRFVGGLYGNGGGSSITITGCIIKQCSFEGTEYIGGIGGLSGVLSGTESILDCQVEGCYIKGSSNQIGGFFGRVLSTSFSLTNCSVVDTVLSGLNSVSCYCGVFYSKFGNISHCICSNVYAYSQSNIGGIIADVSQSISWDSASVNITDCHVSKCTLSSLGNNVGGIYGYIANSGTICTVTDCTVSDCAIIGTSNVSGVGN